MSDLEAIEHELEQYGGTSGDLADRPRIVALNKIDVPEARELANLYYDTAASPLLYERDIWGRFAAALPPGRVLFGSDYPLNVYPQLGAEPEMTRLIAEARQAGAGEPILRENTLRLLSR